MSICRALVNDSRIIVMDESTASLSASEAERLFAIVRDLSASGVAVLYVSHRHDEILVICDRVTSNDPLQIFPNNKLSKTREHGRRNNSYPAS